MYAGFKRNTNFKINNDFKNNPGFTTTTGGFCVCISTAS
jgi:hypothetical protein